MTVETPAWLAIHSMKLSCAPRSSARPTPPTSKTCRRSTSAIPGSVSDEWRHFFESLNEERGGSRNGDRGPSWGIAPPELLENGDLVAALTGDYQSDERNIRANLQAKSHAARLRDVAGGLAARDAGFHPRADADPRLSRHGPSGGRPRSAGPRRPQGAPRAEAGNLRLHRRRPRPADLHRPRARARDGDHAADPAHPAPHLLPPHRRAVHAHHQPDAEGVDPGPHRGRGEGHPLHARRHAAPSSTS